MAVCVWLLACAEDSRSPSPSTDPMIGSDAQTAVDAGRSAPKTDSGATPAPLPDAQPAATPDSAADTSATPGPDTSTPTTIGDTAVPAGDAADTDRPPLLADVPKELGSTQLQYCRDVKGDGKPNAKMSFFISAEHAAGGNFGGLAGADSFCQTLAHNVGITNRSWRAFLSAEGTTGGPKVNARERVGKGPWFNYRGEDIGPLEAFFSTTMKPDTTKLLTHWGHMPPCRDVFGHQVLTGSDKMGNVAPGKTCNDWTSSTGFATAGHYVTNGHAVAEHDNSPCSGGRAGQLSITFGRIYCFAIDP
jgi:hypothetical protein